MAFIAEFDINSCRRSALRVVEVEGDTRSIEPLSHELGETPAKAVFSCHCGHVRAALLGALENEELKEDNCSKCVRVCKPLTRAGQL